MKLRTSECVTKNDAIDFLGHMTPQIEEGMAELGYISTYIRTYLPTLYTIPVYLQKDLLCSYFFTKVVGRPAIHVIHMYVCMYVTVYGWVDAYLRASARVCMDGNSKVRN